MTSPDHVTAFDIAARAMAFGDSCAAIRQHGLSCLLMLRLRPHQRHAEWPLSCFGGLRHGSGLSPASRAILRCHDLCTLLRALLSCRVRSSGSIAQDLFLHRLRPRVPTARTVLGLVPSRDGVFVLQRQLGTTNSPSRSLRSCGTAPSNARYCRALAAASATFDPNVTTCVANRIKQASHAQSEFWL